MRLIMHQLIQYKEHCATYRGFTIRRLPRKAMCPMTRYRVIYDGFSLGLFDAQALATGYIDSLCNEVKNDSRNKSN